VFEKIGHRAAFSPSIVTVAGCLAPDGPRLAAGGTNLPARRLRKAETLVPDWPAVAQAIAAEIPGDIGTIAARVLTGLISA
jgi:CO/xanthine dehydrogenase FAD-binding subunit